MGVALASTKPQGHRPAKTSRIELRATEDDRDLLDRAAAALGTDRSSFLLSQGRMAAQRVLADREQFVLDADAQQEWERINSRPARSFYEHLIPEFERSPTDPLHLLLLLKDIRRTLGR